MAGENDSGSPDSGSAGHSVPEDTRTLKAGAADLQVAELHAGDSIVLPDGRILDAESLLDAIKSGVTTLTIQDGTEVPIEDLLIALGLETGIPTIEEDEGPKNEQASFRHGPELQIIGSLTEEGAIAPTELSYPLPELEDSILGAETGPADLSLLEWSIVGDPSITEGASGLYTVSYTGVTMTSGQTVTISVATGAGYDGGTTDAIPGTDFDSVSAILTFTAGGATSKTVAVSTIDDTVIEDSEDFTVTIADAGAGTITTSQANSIIVDNGDETLLRWTITGNSEVAEGNTGIYTVSYTGASIGAGQTATITVGSADLAGGATNAEAGTDYTSLSTVLTFTSGSGTSQVVSVSTVGDTVLEGTEDFRVTIGGQSAGSIVTSQADTDIVDDDASNLSWNISGPSAVAEGSSATYTVAYAGASVGDGQTVTITVSSADLAGGATNAEAGTDYTALTQVLTFTSGTGSSQTVQVSTIVDTVLEGTEDYRVTIAGQSHGSIGTSQANTIITDDDATNVNWSIAGSSQVGEGGSGTYTVSYTGASIGAGQTATITVGSADLSGGATNAEAGTDYTALSQVLTFTSGSGTSQTVAVSTVGDTVLEGTEDYRVTIGGQSVGNVVASQANTIITDDDASNLNWSIAGSSQVDEGETGFYTVSYTGVTLAAGQTATITVATGASGWTSTLTDAVAGSDFTALSTILTFTSGTGTSQTVAVSTITDALDEDTEDYRVTIDGQNVGTVAASQANTIIIDANQPPIVAPDSCVWVADATNQMTSPYANGYPLQIAAPTDSDNDTLTITSFTLPTSGQIWYQAGGGGAFTPLTGGHTLTIAELQTLTYRPNNNGAAEDSTFTYTVSDGNGGTATGTVQLHEVLQTFIEQPTVSVGSRTANTPLNSGNDITASFTATAEIIAAISTDVTGSIRVATDFQIQPNDVPIPDGEQAAALAFLVDQVAVRVIINGVTFDIVIPDNGTPGSGDNTEYWTFDSDTQSSTYGVWVADVPASQIWNAAHTQTLEQYLNTPGIVSPGDTWTVVYEDFTGGNEQARFAEFSFGEGGTSTVPGGLSIDGSAVEGCADEMNLMYGTTLNDTLSGGNVNDRIYGREGNDILAGGTGDDSIDGGNNNDTLSGNNGNDTLVGGAGDDVLRGGAGDDTIDGGAGLADLIDWSDVTIGITHTLVTSAGITNVTIAGHGTDAYSNIEGMIGGSAADNLTGNTGNNTINGNGGNDTISGGDGGDTIVGGDGTDSLSGDNGNDRISGDDGSDTLLGGAGADTLLGGDDGDSLVGGAGADSLSGGEGTDTIRFSDADNDSVDGGAGVDVIILDQTSLNFDSVSDAQLTSVEVLDLGASDGVGRAVTLDAADVLDFEAITGLTVDPDGGGALGVDAIDLIILGASTDSVSLDNNAGENWTAGATGVSLTGFGGTFDIYYTNNGTVVAIDDDVTFSGFS